MRESNRTLSILAVCLLMFTAVACSAGTWTVLLRATDDAGNVLAQQLFEGFHPEGETRIPLGSVQLGSYGEIEDVNLHLFADPLVDFGFNVKSLDPTVWLELGAVESVIPPLQPVNARASAGVSLTPAGGDPGATIVGGYNGTVWKAYYNTNITFSEMVGGWSLTPDVDGNYVTETRPGSSTGVIAAPSITEIGIIYRFQLSQGDRASGTGEFEVTEVAEPAGILALLCGVVGLAGMAARRREQCGSQG